MNLHSHILIKLYMHWLYSCSIFLIFSCQFCQIFKSLSFHLILLYLFHSCHSSPINSYSISFLFLTLFNFSSFLLILFQLRKVKVHPLWPLEFKSKCWSNWNLMMMTPIMFSVALPFYLVALVGGNNVDEGAR